MSANGNGRDPITLTLTPAQLAAVRDAPAPLAAILKPGALTAAQRHYDEWVSGPGERGRLGSSSLLRGLALLSIFEPGERYRIKDLAETMGMNISTVHRYLATLFTLGLIDRDSTSRLYFLPE